jgi:hypothetical protein
LKLSEARSIATILRKEYPKLFELTSGTVTFIQYLPVGLLNYYVFFAVSVSAKILISPGILVSRI